MMRYITAILLAILSVNLSVTFADAEEIQVKPEISKYNTASLFEDSKEYESSELIVKFKSSVSEEEKSRILQSVKVKELSSQNKGDFSLISTPKSTELVLVAEDLLKFNQIEFVEPNYQLENTYTPKDPLYSKQWHLKKIQSPKAWDQTKGASGVTVAVIDSGVQTNHPDITGKIVSPFNAVSGGTTFAPADHGTHVAGIIAATLNKTGVAGVAPNVKIMPINVFTGDSASTYDVADAIVYAADHHADIINMSLGGRMYSYILDYAAAYARSKGVLIIAAAGNEDTYYNTYPAALDGVLGVSATDSNDKITNFSNYGYYIDFAAPGKSIYSTVKGSSYKALDGTSMASPVVSGVAALILSKNPLLTADQVETILRKSSVDLGSKGWDYYYGYGRVDAYRALQNTSVPISNISLSSSSFTMKGTNKANISFSASGGTKVSLYIQSTKGTTLKKVIYNKVWGGGKLSASWDGKQDNGTFVPGGTYKVLAKVSSSRGTLYKSASLKVVDKVVPSIKLASSAVYSPPVKGKLTIPYELNKNAKVTAIIYDKNKKAIKTLLNNSSVSSGKKSIYWDGKNSKGSKVTDGTYTLSMSVIDSNKLKGTTRKFAITVDAAKPTGKTTLTSTIFKMDGSLKNAGKIDFNENVYLTAYVTTDKGVKIKKLNSEKYLKKGTFTLSWNGKNDKSQFLTEGKYQYLIELRDVAGNKSSVKSALFTLQDWIKPTIQGSKDFYYRTEGNTAFSYTISKPGKVTVQILKDSNVVRTIDQNVSKAKGKQAFVWDGKDQSGNLLADGKYTYKVTIVDAYKLTQTYTGNMHVALTQIEIKHPTVVQLSYENNAEVYYELSQPATVTIEIYDNDGKRRTIVTGASVSGGINTFKWDGLDDDGYYVSGDAFTYKIKAKNSVGNETTVTGKIQNDEYPYWLTSQTYSLTSSDDYSWIYKLLNLELTVTEPIKASLYVLDSEYSDEFIDFRDYDLIKGTNKIVYQKPDEWNYYYYVLGYTDSLGNKYYYGIDEYDYRYSYSKTSTKQKFRYDVNRTLMNSLK